jgi:uncharacterized protein YihD (DUF1040 family)
MDKESKIILKNVGIEFENLSELNGLFITSETLLSDNKYDEIKKLIPELKKNDSSSLMTSLQKTAEQSQKWPLLNLVRQILNIYNYKMEPVRKADGYTLEGVKKYKRFFLIKQKILIQKNISENEESNLLVA